MTRTTALRRALSLLGLLAVFAIQPSWVLAGTSGNMSGVVRDAATGAPLAGVRLQISSPSQSVETTTDAHGHFVVFYLPPDDYTLTAQKAGYDTRSISGYTINADQSQVYDVQLTPSTTPAGT
jgi:uncharacterized surface anchored protein